MTAWDWFWLLSAIVIAGTIEWAVLPLQRRRVTMASTATYGHPFDVVAEVKQYLPRPPDDCWWELGVNRKDHRDRLTLALCSRRHLTVDQMATDGYRTLAARTIDLTTHGTTDYADLYRRSTALARSLAFASIVTDTAEWAVRTSRQHSESDDGPLHHEVIM